MPGSARRSRNHTSPTKCNARTVFHIVDLPSHAPASTPIDHRPPDGSSFCFSLTTWHDTFHALSLPRRRGQDPLRVESSTLDDVDNSLLGWSPPTSRRRAHERLVFHGLRRPSLRMSNEKSYRVRRSRWSFSPRLFGFVCGGRQHHYGFRAATHVSITYIHLRPELQVLHRTLGRAHSHIHHQTHTSARAGG